MRVIAIVRAAVAAALLTMVASVTPAVAQQAVAPTVIPLSGQLLTADGQPRAGSVLLIVSLYQGQNDPTPRWIEQQHATLDALGRYTLEVGATLQAGLPADLFAGDAPVRWLGVAPQGETEQPRVMLVSVPYAAKAASAETLAGKTASDFVLTSTFRDDVRAAIEDVRNADDDTVGTEAVTLDYLQKGDGLGGTTDSALFETGGNVGFGTTTPQTLLHLRAPLNLPAFRLENTEPGAAAWQVTSASDGQFRLTEVGAAVRLVINKGSGTVGIGTGNPQTLLHMRAGLNLPAFRLENSEPAGATWQVTSALDGQFRLTEVGAATRFVVAKTTGNVGIGTGAPTSKLHVVGDAVVTGALSNPTITTLLADVAALAERVAKLESGQVTAADMVGTYALQYFGMQLLGNPGRVGMESFGGTVVLNADGTGAFTAAGGDCTLQQGTPWAVECGVENGVDPLTWRVENGYLITVDSSGEESEAIIGAGGRVAIFGGIVEFMPGAGFSNLGIAIRLPNP